MISLAEIFEVFKREHGIGDIEIIRITVESLLERGFVEKSSFAAEDEHFESKRIQLNQKDRFRINRRFKFTDKKYDLRKEFRKLAKSVLRTDKAAQRALDTRSNGRRVG